MPRTPPTTFAALAAATCAALLALALFAVAPAGATGVASATIDPQSGFPIWYQDSKGDRVEQCLDANDPNCVVLAGPTFNPAAPLDFPTNFPDEFFYALADSEIVDTPGCGPTAPGKASVRLALEGAFVNGDPAPNEQIVFGRIRVKVTSGLCPNTTYQFRHPFGTEILKTNDNGAIPANVGTEDIGCVGIVPPQKCAFSQAGTSRVFGSVTGGFVRWDPAAGPAAPSGYLGDGATPHAVTGGTAGNAFEILDSQGNPLPTPLRTALFTVAGKLAGPLLADPSPADFGGQDLGVASAVKRVTITNVDSRAVTVQSTAITGAGAAEFGKDGGCVGVTLQRDQTCQVGVTFTPAGAGRRTAALQVASTGGSRSPLDVALTGSGINTGDAPAISATPAGALDFAGVRVRTVSPIKPLTVTNTGTAPLGVTGADLTGDAADTSQYRVATDTCSGRFVDPGRSCEIGLQFMPLVAGPHPATLAISANINGSPHRVELRGTGTGGDAAVSAGVDPDNGFPVWYRDEADVKLSQCIDPADANCIVLADDFFDPAQPLRFPSNFPEEFFYTVADSDIITTPGCGDSPPGKAFMRSAVEAAFTGAGPADGEQMTFGRLRVSVTSGLCAGRDYTFTTPYGEVTFTANARGGVARARGTEDVGCVPVAPDTCDFSQALSSRILAGFLRWDPSVAPAAPAGYIGDAATLHKVVGAPYKPDGVTPANFFAISDSAGTEIGRTDRFTVMGRLRGPLEADPVRDDFSVVTVGSTSSSHTITLKNSGLSPIDVTAASSAGADAAMFDVSPGTCVGGTLAPGATCTVSATFAPTAQGLQGADLVVRHSGLNDPLVVPLTGTGGAPGGTPAISFLPRSADFAPLHVGRTSPVQTVKVSNAGGGQPLDVRTATIGGANPASFEIAENRCTDLVPPGGACEIDVAFTPQAAGALTGSLTVTDNAPGGTHALPLSGRGSAANPAVSAATDSRNGYPQYYQDSSGVRLAPCLDPADANCIVLSDAFFNPADPVKFPSNFPGEFFYGVADSDIVATDGCPGAGIGAGTAFLRVALEGAFANGGPAAGEQITFGRVRIVVRGGLCPNTPYRFQTPYGPVNITSDAVGAVTANRGTTDIGCGPVAPATCDFAEALTSPVADSFLRWAPGVGAAAPAGYLGDAVTLHRVVGGTSGNAFQVFDSAGNPASARTELFTVSGKVAGPLVTDADDLDLGHAQVGSGTGTRTITVTNVGAAPMDVASVATTGTDAALFAVDPASTCPGARLAVDATCTVRVAFRPPAAATTGSKAATLRISPATGPAALVSLTGIADPAASPVAVVSPGVLAFGTVTAGASPTLATTVRNTGTAPLTVDAPALTGPNAADYAVSANTCAAPVAPNGSCQVTVRFTPRATGARTATLSLPHNAAGSPTSVSLTGTGAAATFTLSPSSVSFGGVNVNTTKSQTVTVKNAGTVAGTVASLAATSSPAGAFTTAAIPAACVNLAPGRTCSVTVNFRPTQRVNHTGTLTVTGDARTLPATVTASMTGLGK